jgi:hypothetical protein
MDDYALKQQLVGELKETMRIKKLNLELMDSLESTTIFLLEESKKLGLELPNAKTLGGLLKHVQGIYNECQSTDFYNKENNRRMDRTFKQYSYKVPVPYSTVW